MSDSPPLLHASEATLDSIVGVLADPTNPPLSAVEQALQAFAARFPLERLATLQGEQLLLDLHGREGNDSLKYWLEHKADDAFHAHWFGSIRGGSSAKFGVWQRAEDNAWMTGHGKKMHPISTAEASAIAERQRDQLLAALAVVRALPEDPAAPAYDQLAAAAAQAAPDIHHLAFVHKFLHLHTPRKLDDYHSPPVQTHVLVSLGAVPRGEGLFGSAAHFVGLLRQVEGRLGHRTTMRAVTSALNGLVGAPIRHWRIGTGDKGTRFPAMRDGGHVAIGWGALGDLRDVLDGLSLSEAHEVLKGAIASRWPKAHGTLVGRSAAQVRRFFQEIEVGHRV